ncbi:MAG: Ig-like domain-containing protein, partial [Sulfurimonas sp.]|nr:Ig-like domain-containing protein [Sulfurimonas sp.]
MSEVIGKISSLDGKFYVKLSDGSFNEISHGDEIYEGDIVVGDKNNIAIDSIRIDLDNGSNVIVYGSETQLFDSSLYSEEFAENETVSDSESIEAIFNSENTEAIVEEDIDDVETEAGEESGSESTEGGEAQFATVNGGIVDINADLRELVSTDSLGNEVTSSATSTHTVDTSADAGVVTPADVTADDIINAAESGETITLSGTATGGDISTGDTVSMTINGNDYTTTVQADGTYSVDVAGADLAADTSFNVNVVSTDSLGNEVT